MKKALLFLLPAVSRRAGFRLHGPVLILLFFLLPATSLAVEVHFEGARPEWLATLYANLSLDDLPCDAEAWRVRIFFERAEGEIERALRAFGHYRPEISKKLERREGCWRATFVIDPGPVVRIARVEVSISGEARGDPAFSELLAALPLKPGDPLRHDRYEALKRELLELARRRGYFGARFRKRVLLVDPEHLRAEVVLHLESGPRYRIGPVRFLGGERLRAELIGRFLPFREGEPYREEALAELQEELLESGYFQSVEVVPLVEETRDHEVPIEVRLLPRKRHLVQVGVGFETSVGPRGKLRYENRLLGPAGNRLEFSGSLTPITGEATLNYLLPLWKPAHQWFAFQTGYLREAPGNFTTQRLQVSGRLLGRWEDYEEEYSLGLHYERSRSGGQRSTLLFLLPQAFWHWREAQDGLSPTRGWRLGLSLTPGLGLAGGSPLFARGLLSFKGIQMLPFHSRLLGRVELGGIWSTAFEQVPASQRFWTGGFDSIRGFGYKQIGGSGGRYLLVGSLEYEKRVRGPFSLALFVDGGGIYRDFGEPTFVGTGIGLRWSSPIGPLRLDLATPVRGKEPILRVYFSFGPEL